MTVLAAIGITLSTFGFMEFWAWFMHKYVQHGPLWFLHRSHHVRHPHPVERNDLFFLIYGSISAVLFITGDNGGRWWFWVAHSFVSVRPAWPKVGSLAIMRPSLQRLPRAARR